MKTDSNINILNLIYYLYHGNIGYHHMLENNIKIKQEYLLTNLERRLKKEIYSKYNMSYHNFVEKFIDEKKTFRTIKIKNYNTTVNLSVGYKNKYVFILGLY